MNTLHLHINVFMICFILPTRPVYGFDIKHDLPLPEWITLSLVSNSLQVNGLNSQLYKVNSRLNSIKTNNKLREILTQSTKDPDYPVNRNHWNDHILISQFRPPVFITLELIQSDFSTQGTLLVSDLETINSNWKDEGFPLSRMNDLLLTGKIADYKPQLNSETFTLDSTADFKSSYRLLFIQAISEQWQKTEYSEQPSDLCQVGFFVRPTEKLYLSSCQKSISGSQVNVVWEQY